MHLFLNQFIYPKFNRKYSVLIIDLKLSRVKKLLIFKIINRPRSIISSIEKDRYKYLVPID